MSSSEGFWDFSNRIYRVDHVSHACLSLQDESGADVNMLLFCCWAATVNVELSDDQFQNVLRFSRSWADDIVRPLRAIRSTMKHDGGRLSAVPIATFSELRENIKKIELQAEKLQQQQLETMIGTATSRSETTDLQYLAVSNLRRYCRAEHIDLTTSIIDKLMIILLAAIPSTTKQAARDLLD